MAKKQVDETVKAANEETVEQNGQAQPVIDSITINGDELKILDQIVGQIPTLYGVKIIQFFDAIRKKSNLEAQLKATKGEKKTTAITAPRKIKSRIPVQG